MIEDCERYEEFTSWLTAVRNGVGARKPRVYLGERESWQQASTLVHGTYTGATKTEQIKTLTQYCPSITITGDESKADLFVLWDSKTWQQTSWGGHENEFTLYSSNRDVLGTGAAHHMKNAAKDICKLIDRKFTSASPKQ